MVRKRREGVCFADKAREIRRSGAEWPARSVFELQPPLHEQADGVVAVLKSDSTSNDLYGAVWKLLPREPSERRKLLEHVFDKIDSNMQILKKREIVRELEHAYDLVR